jgi:hypothetical protein
MTFRDHVFAATEAARGHAQQAQHLLSHAHGLADISLVRQQMQQHRGEARRQVARALRLRRDGEPHVDELADMLTEMLTEVDRMEEWATNEKAVLMWLRFDDPMYGTVYNRVLEETGVRFQEVQSAACRAQMAAGRIPEPTGGGAAGGPAGPKETRDESHDLEEYMERIALAVGDETAVKILAIAGRKDWSGDRRMREILELDRRFAAKDSNEWPSLLRVTPAAVRGYETWKLLRGGRRDG